MSVIKRSVCSLLELRGLGQHVARDSIPPPQDPNGTFVQTSRSPPAALAFCWLRIVSSPPPNFPASPAEDAGSPDASWTRADFQWETAKLLFAICATFLK